MTTITKELYDALREAGASEEKADAAARAISENQDESRLRDMERDVAETKGDIKLLKWMIGFNVALTTAVLLKLLILP